MMDTDEIDALAYLQGYVQPEHPDVLPADWHKEVQLKKGTEEYERARSALIRLLRGAAEGRPFPRWLFSALADHHEVQKGGRPREAARNTAMHEYMWSIFRENGRGPKALESATKLCAKKFDVPEDWAAKIWDRYEWYRKLMVTGNG
jgi:hypothetical protein